MLSVALHNPKQHLQWAVTGSLTLVASNPEACDWKVVQPIASTGGERVEIRGREGNCLRVQLGAGREATLTLEPSTQVTIGETRFEFSLPRARRPLEELLTYSMREGDAESPFSGPSSRTVADWFTAVAEMNALVTTSPTFYHQAAEHMLQVVRLDGVIVLLQNGEGGGWQIAGSALPCPDLGIACPFDLVDQLTNGARTQFHGRPTGTDKRLPPERDEIVSPLIDSRGQIVGAVYGYRCRGGNSRRRGYRHLEARLFDMLARSLGVAIERARQERQLTRQRANLERSFAPAVLRLVEQEAELLRGSERDVTVLMADLRGFTGVCQRLSTDGSYELVNEVMEFWTECVMNCEGTLVDYYGDGLAALWNAPSDQNDHPQRAITAALQMTDCLPHVSRKWKSRLAEPLRLGIGLHSGVSKVGNIGTPSRLKYGARGLTVNLASRLEGATKLVGVPLLLSKSTARRVSPQQKTLRICRMLLRNFIRPLEVFIPLRESGPMATLASEAYTAALASYEHGDFARASEQLRECPAGTEVPREFLRQQIELAMFCQRGRRRSDKKLIALAAEPLLSGD
jgi:adenylate cyclase